jgi:hypothetical protein
MQLTTPIEESLNKFREVFPVTKVLQEDDQLLYIFRNFYNAKKCCSEANVLIERLGLDLVAIHYGSNSFFSVKRNDVEL